MAEPFRDEMSNAIARVDRLAEENADLRREVQTLRVAAGRIRTKTEDPHAHELADQTLSLLEQLDAAIDRHADTIARPEAIEVPAAEPPTDALERPPAVRAPHPAAPPSYVAQVPPRVVGIALVMFVLGVVVGALVTSAVMGPH